MASDEEPTAAEVVVHTSGRQEPPDLRLIHYNDVYHCEPGSQEPIGGITRFQTVCDHYRNSKGFEGQTELITLFSGDAFNPSLESSITKGSHMVSFLNNIGTDCACVGNHDLDFGVLQFQYLSSQCSFPWLIANVLDPGLGEDVPLGNAKKTLLITASNGIKIGIIGLVEREWLDTINSLPPNLIYKSASATAAELVPGLRGEGAQIIIALTHQREPNDNKLAEKTPLGLIDVILGGHDHFYRHTVVKKTHVLRSGTDFKQLSYLKAWKKQDDSPGWDFEIIRRDVVRDMPEDPKTVELVGKLTSALKSMLEKPIGYTVAPLDSRFTTVRLKESNYGNFVCDLMRLHYQADCAIMAGGTMRGDQIYPSGVIRLKDIMNCFPFEDPCIVLRVKGKAIWEALENSVSKYPALEGRFSQVSNIQFEFDARAPAGSRIRYINIGKAPLNPTRRYTLATRGYMGRGKDGFSSLLVESAGGEAEEIVSEENGILISMMMRQYFMSVKILGRWRWWGEAMRRHWGGVHQVLHAKHPVNGAVAPGAETVDRLAAGADAAPSGSLKRHRSGPGQAGAKRPKTEVDGHVIDSDSEDEDKDLKPVPTAASERERELVVMRKVLRKWWRIAGLPGHPSMGGEEEGEFLVGWTKSIAPRLEGRIRQTRH